MFTPTLIVSEAGCVQQQWHFDYPQNAGTIKSIKVKNSFFLVVSIMEGTSFQGCNNITHEILPKIKLNIGDILIGRGDFLHAGDAYDVDNIRIHFYVDFSKFFSDSLVQTILSPKYKHIKRSESSQIRDSDEVYLPLKLDSIIFRKQKFLFRAHNFAHAKAGYVRRKAQKAERLSHFKHSSSK